MDLIMSFNYTDLREQICKIFNILPEELEFKLPNYIGIKKMAELETLITQLETAARIDELISMSNIRKGMTKNMLLHIQDRIKTLTKPDKE